MKKLFLPIALASTLFSCEQSSVKQTTDTIKSADELIKNANEGFRTLDSISKVVNDSATVRKINIPEIDRVKKQAEEAIKSGNFDSISGTIDNVTREIGRGTDIVKTVDSANQILKKDGSVIDKITTITQTISKVSKQAKKAELQKQQPTVDQKTTPPSDNTDNNLSKNSEIIAENPMVKTARLDINVDEIAEVRNQIVQDLQNYNGEIVTESLGQEAGHNRLYITAKVPYKYFDQGLNQLEKIGKISDINIEAEGTDFNPNQMCDIELNIVENAAKADGVLSSDINTPKSEAGNAFNKGFKNFGNVMIWLLPFWPFLLIGAIIWFLAARRKRKKHEAEVLRMQQEIERIKAQNLEKQNANATKEMHSEIMTEQKPATENGSDYSKYMPK